MQETGTTDQLPTFDRELGDVEWDNSRKIEVRLQDQLDVGLNPDGKEVKHFKGYHLITRDSPIQGGVYPGLNPREAIFVDEAEDTRLAETYRDFLIRLKEYDDQKFDTRRNMLGLVFAFVTDIMPSSNFRSAVTASSVDRDDLIPLSAFLDGGVCRHQALLAGFLLEKLIADKRIEGKVSVDRNSVHGFGSHAWVRFTDINNEVYVLDVTHQLFKKMADIPTENPPWPYARDEDLAKRKKGLWATLANKMKVAFS